MAKKKTKVVFKNEFEDDYLDDLYWLDKLEDEIAKYQRKFRMVSTPKLKKQYKLKVAVLKRKRPLLISNLAEYVYTTKSALGNRFERKRLIQIGVKEKKDEKVKNQEKR